MTNEAALGYALIAARAIKMSERHIAILVSAMSEALDEHTELEAEQVFKQD